MHRINGSFPLIQNLNTGISMEPNLIEEIKKAEKNAADSVSKAEKNADRKRKKLIDLHKKKIESLDDEYRKKKQGVLNQAHEDSVIAKEKSKQEVKKKIEKIEKGGNMKKKEVIDFFLNKILE